MDQNPILSQGWKEISETACAVVENGWRMVNWDSPQKPSLRPLFISRSIPRASIDARYGTRQTSRWCFRKVSIGLSKHT